MKKIIQYAHLFLEEHLNKNCIFVDFTLGNGHDSYYVYHKVKKLYAFDIQQSAIDKSLINYPVLKNADLILDSHTNIQQYVSHFDAGIFNLGYLPNGNKDITTHYHSTITAIKNALQILNKNGILIVVVYIGHENGKIESNHLQTFCETLHGIHVSQFTLKNKPTAPYILIFEK